MCKSDEKSQLYTLVELLFMPMTFYVLTLFDKIDTWQRGVGWFIVFALVQNEYLSIKITKAKYNIWLYLLDLISLFVYLFALRALLKPHPIIGYSPWFWICLSVLWLGYALWDFLMLSQETVPETKGKLKQWGWTMLLFFFITLLCGLGLLSTVNQPILPDNKYLIYILQFIPFCFVVWAIALWLKDLGSLLSK